LLHPDDSKRFRTVDNLKSHPFFSELSWEEVEEKEVVPPFIPPVCGVTRVTGWVTSCLHEWNCGLGPL